MDNVNTDVETSNTKDHAQPPLPQRDRLPEPTPVEGWVDGETFYYWCPPSRSWQSHGWTPGRLTRRSHYMGEIRMVNLGRMPKNIKKALDNDVAPPGFGPDMGSHMTAELLQRLTRENLLAAFDALMRGNGTVDESHFAYTAMQAILTVYSWDACVRDGVLPREGDVKYVMDSSYHDSRFHIIVRQIEALVLEMANARVVGRPW